MFVKQLPNIVTAIRFFLTPLAVHALLGSQDGTALWLCLAASASDFADAARTAVINKRAGGTGLISGRKAFQRPMPEGVKLLNIIQDVYLDKTITVA